MEKQFVEVNLETGRMLVNIDSIHTVQETEEGCSIVLEQNGKLQSYFCLDDFNTLSTRLTGKI